MMERKLSLNNLAVGHVSAFSQRAEAVVAGITAELQPGEMVCLIGSNGAGKSTLLHTLAGMLPLLEGTITLGDDDLVTITPKERAKLVGLVLTHPTEVENITVGELVALGRSPYTGFFGTLSQEDEELVNSVMQMVGIESLADRKLTCLSDGERQKAMIAKALAQQTPIILLDEPTAFLDFRSKVELLSLLRQLATEEKKIVLLSTHDVSLAIKMAHRLWFVDGGKIHEITMPLSENDEQLLLRFLGPEASKYL